MRVCIYELHERKCSRKGIVLPLAHQITRVKRILVLRFSSIGDIVLTTPVVRCIKAQLGDDWVVDFLVKDNYKSILEANPHLDKVYSFKENVQEVIAELKEVGYDYVIDLHKNIRSFQVRNQLKAPAYSFDKLNWQKWLLVNFKINRLPEVHIVDRYMKSVAPLGVHYDGKGLDYFIPPKEEIDLAWELRRSLSAV